MTRQDVFSTVLQLVCNVFDSYSAVLFLPDPRSGCSLAASFSLGDSVRQGMALAPGQGLAGWIIREGKPLLISDFDRKRGVLGYYSGKAEDEIRAFLGVPLPDVMGALCLDSKKVHGFGDKDLKILSEFAALVSQLYLEREEIAENLTQTRLSQCLRRISGLARLYPKWSAYLRHFLNEAAEASGFEHCFLAVQGDAAKVFTIEGASRAVFPHDSSGPESFPLSGGMIGWVFKNNTPVYSQDAEITVQRLFGVPGGAMPFTRLICEPVCFSRRVWSVLALASREEGALYGAHKEFARGAADQMASFLETLRLKSQLAKRGQ